MTEIREVNVILGKNGKGYLTPKITLPLPWIKKMGITENSRKVSISFDEKTIVISVVGKNNEVG